MRGFFEAFVRDGLDGVLDHLHPEIEWTTTGAFLEAATYRDSAAVPGTMCVAWNRRSLDWSACWWAARLPGASSGGASGSALPMNAAQPPV